MRQLHLALLLCSFSMAQAADWDPIPATTWAIKEGPKGAVVLIDKKSFKRKTIEYTFQVRIFSESGRSAAEFPDFPSTTTRIEGRTVYPDGRTVQFSNRKDFAERVIESGTGDFRQTHLIAPGVSSDCVVEIRWEELANGPLGGIPRRFSNGNFGKWRLANAYPTEMLSVEILEPFPLSWTLESGTFTPEGGKTARSFIFKKLPAMELPPFSLVPDIKIPCLFIYYLSPGLVANAGASSDEYWQNIANTILKNSFEGSVKVGPAFGELAAELTKNLPPGKLEAASELMARLDRSIANVSSPTFAEQAALPKNFFQDLDPKDLNAAAKRSRTSGTGMIYLFYHLLKARGIAGKIAYVPNRQYHYFDWSSRSLHQFDRTLIGVEEEGKGVLWFDATMRFATPGLVHPDFTLVPALVVDSKTWRAEKGQIPTHPASAHVSKYIYRLTPEEGSNKFDLRTEFSGYPEYRERRAFLAQEPSAQDKSLKDTWERRLKNATIEKAKVQDGTSNLSNITWQVSGTIEQEGGRRREMDPFPGMPWPLTIPSELETSRKIPIVLGFPGTHLAESTFPVPDGFTLDIPQEIRSENHFGRVIWILTYDAEKRQGRVVLRTDIVTAKAGAERWKDFRNFLTWVEQACRRRVVFKKAA